MHFKVLKKIVLIVFLQQLCVSCTYLQWRSSDEEIYDKFKDLDIPTSITYFSIDSLDLNLRIQKIEQSNRDLNIVFFHGSPSSLSVWDDYLSDSILIDKANLYAVDRPGYGYSNFGDEVTSIQKQAEIMNAAIDNLSLKNILVVGSSYGGPLAARLAVINKDVLGVAMISPAIDPDQEKRVKGQMFTQYWLTRWLVPTGYRVAGDEKVTHADELALIDKDWSDIEIPILHIHGDKDNLVPYGNVNYTKQKFKNIEIVTTPNTGHEIAWARPELIKPHLIKLIDAVLNFQKQE